MKRLAAACMGLAVAACGASPNATPRASRARPPPARSDDARPPAEAPLAWVLLPASLYPHERDEHGPVLDELAATLRGRDVRELRVEVSFAAWCATEPLEPSTASDGPWTLSEPDRADLRAYAEEVTQALRARGVPEVPASVRFDARILAGPATHGRGMLPRLQLAVRVARPPE